MSSPASATLQVADEHLHEPGAVPSLERQLLVVDDDRGHASGQRGVGGPMSAADGALDRSGQAGVDPVAGEVQSPRTAVRARAAAAGPAQARTSRAARERPWRAGACADRARGNASRSSSCATAISSSLARFATTATRRSRRATGARPTSPNACRLSNTHCIARPGQADERLVEDRAVEPEVDGHDRRRLHLAGVRSAMSRSGSRCRRRTHPRTRTRAPPRPRRGASNRSAPLDTWSSRSPWSPIFAGAPVLTAPPCCSMNARAGSAYIASSGRVGSRSPPPSGRVRTSRRARGQTPARRRATAAG